MADRESDLTESATPYKLEQARKNGSVAKSTDLVAAFMLAAALCGLVGYGMDGAMQTRRIAHALFRLAGERRWNADQMMTWLSQTLLDMLHILLPFFLALGIAAVLAHLLQTGPLFSMRPLSPDLNRINPANGLQRLFALRSFYEFIKSLVKTGILILLAWLAVRDLMPGVAGLREVDPKVYIKLMFGLAGDGVSRLILTLFIFAVFDFAYAKWDFAQRMRMSRRELRDENRQREGDSRIRARIRALRRDMLKRSTAIRRLPSADVMITNPTHLAVALRYRQGEAAAPQLVAKGAGELAHKMRAVAARHHIPVIQNKALARELFRDVDCEECVPERLYPQLAKIMVWVYAMREVRTIRQSETILGRTI
jgi:flagellar biosynthetic protein FlhB